MLLRFGTRARGLVFLFAILSVSGLMSVLAGRNWVAEKRAGSARPEDWLRAAQLETDNAEYWYRLGRYRHLAFKDADLPLAISYYQRAVALNPASALYWTDLALAYETSGNSVEARAAFETAKRAHPISAQVAWQYGNFLLRQQQFSQAFAEIRRAVLTDPKLARLAASRCWRATRDLESTLEHAIPPTAENYWEALDAMVAEREYDAALLVWKRLIPLRQPPELRRIFALLDRLVDERRIEDARNVWLQATGEHPGTSLVWDGGFEQGLTNGGFGWRQTEIPGASFDFDTDTRHSGARSLRVTFDGSANVDFAHLQQLVPVSPNTQYRFSAFLRTDNLSTDSGVRFTIRFPYNAADPALLTPNMTGTEPWTLQQTDFITGADTHLAQIVLRRLPSQKFDNKIQGTVWVDDVSLNPLKEPGGRHLP